MENNGNKYFEVRREVLSGITTQFNVLSDGENAGTSESEGEARSITTGFTVWEYDEDYNHIKTEFYPVTTDTADWSDDAEEQLENIKRDYPADIWQNNEW